MMIVEPTRVRHVVGVEPFRPGILPSPSPTARLSAYPRRGGPGERDEGQTQVVRRPALRRTRAPRPGATFTA